MKRVLIFAPTAPASGITQYILNMLGAFDTDAVRFDILSFRNHRLKAWCEAHGTEYFEFDLSPYKQRRAYMAYLKRVFAREYDVIHYHLSSLSELAILRLGVRRGRRIVVHSHNTFTDVPSKLRRAVFGTLHKLLRGYACRYSDVKCGCSAAAAAWMFGRAAKDAVVMNNAIDTDKFAYNEAYRAELRARYHAEGKRVIGHIGRFSAQKNQPFLLESFAALCQTDPTAVLWLIGNGELWNVSKQKAEELGIADRVTFIDFQEDIYKYYSAFDLFVLPSLFEGLPITMVEAQANGLTLLVSDAVTAESDLTGRVEFYPLAEGAAAWGARMAVKLQDTARAETAGQLAEKGFSLKGQAAALYALYFE